MEKLARATALLEARAAVLDRDESERRRKQAAVRCAAGSSMTIANLRTQILLQNAKRAIRAGESAKAEFWLNQGAECPTRVARSITPPPVAAHIRLTTVSEAEKKIQKEDAEDPELASTALQSPRLSRLTRRVGARRPTVMNRTRTASASRCGRSARGRIASRAQQAKQEALKDVEDTQKHVCAALRQSVPVTDYAPAQLKNIRNKENHLRTLKNKANAAKVKPGDIQKVPALPVESAWRSRVRAAAAGQCEGELAELRKRAPGSAEREDEKTAGATTASEKRRGYCF